MIPAGQSWQTGPSKLEESDQLHLHQHLHDILDFHGCFEFDTAGRYTFGLECKQNRTQSMCKIAVGCMSVCLMAALLLSLKLAQQHAVWSVIS